ncbi:MAG: radical SAM protein [Chloroflexota bacterium]
MIHEIQAVTLLNSVKQPDPWFGLKYNMNLYRGCQHQCIYCDSRSQCYGIENFRDILVKVNAIDLLRQELARKRVKGTIGTGSMNDPYMPVEKQYRLTAQALAVIAQFRFPVHVITKSDLVLRDLETLRQINAVYAAVSFSLSTVDDDLARKVEPGAPVPSRRLQAMAQLAQAGIVTGVVMMPVLPFIEDEAASVQRLVQMAVDHGASYIIPSLGVTLRDRQRAYYYAQLDCHFPGLRQQYQRRYGRDYFCPVPEYGVLQQAFAAWCAAAGLPTRMPMYEPETAQQLSLF